MSAVTKFFFRSSYPSQTTGSILRWWENYSALGPTLSRYGFTFAFGLSLLPIPVALVGWGDRLFGLLQFQ